MKDKPVLEKIGISDEMVKKWKKKGLRITYPMKENPRWLKSADGEVFIENADKFVSPLTKREIKLYIEYPANFRGDFLKNLKFYKKFCNFVYEKQELTKKLKSKEKIAALLSLIYLFQRGMDYYYYHWDRYLVYEDYPETPVGYWWKKAKDLYVKVKKEKVPKQRPPEDFLKLIILDKKTLKEFKKLLSKKDFLKLRMALKAIKIFEDAQQREVEMLMDYNRKVDILRGTCFPMLVKFWGAIEKHPEFIKKERKLKIRAIKKLHPIIGARRLLLTSTLKCFDKEIFSQFQREIERWL